ncbi:SurA N-terminal domain-containing protein [Jiangella anatolica]|uniref:SurA N-terminal domain-containing protein n=1 Tax=Jiangella anatolica TaxID=2670374 RepID=UPI0013146306|nr:SurA N-terminal domain-containing protein [Jiangella anatolica]
MSTIRRIVIASLAAASAVALAGCDSDQIGAAVVIDGDRFTVDDLQNAVEHAERQDGFDVEAAGGMQAFQRTVLTRHIQHEIFLRLAADEEIEVSEADIDDAIDEIAAQAPGGDLGAALAQAGYTDDAFRAGVADQLIAQTFSEENGADAAALTQVLVDLGNELNVDVNPRYGTWGEDLSVSADTGSISEPAS